MNITLRAEQAYDEASARRSTGRSLGEWFGLLDEFGGPAKGRREIGHLLVAEHRLAAWWSSTIIGLYEAAHGLREKDGRQKGYSICATKSIKSDVSTCYEQFTTAGALDAWLGRGHRLEFKEGGSLVNNDGNTAIVKKIDPGKTISLIWTQKGVAEDTPVRVRFDPAGMKSTVTIVHERLQTREEADGMRAAWGRALEILKQVVEG